MITKTWFIESNDFDEVLVSTMIDIPFEEPSEGDSHKQLELFTTEDLMLDDVGF